MPTLSVSTELDVLTKYRQLVKESLGSESTYIRAKETLSELMDNNNITKSERAAAVSQLVSSIATGVTSASMSTALQWASAERDLQYRRLQLEKELEILDSDNRLKNLSGDKIANDIRLAKVESKRVYGTAVFDSLGNVTSLAGDGKVAKDIELVDQQIAKLGADKLLTEQRLKESYAAVHKIVADTYNNFGNYSYSGLSSSGVDTVTKKHGDYKTLSDTQRDIAIEQAKGYTYNAWANALTGSSSMLGTAISTGLAEFTDVGSPGSILLDTVLDAAKNLKEASTVTDEAIPVN